MKMQFPNTLAVLFLLSGCSTNQPRIPTDEEIAADLEKQKIEIEEKQRQQEATIPTAEFEFRGIKMRSTIDDAKMMVKIPTSENVYYGNVPNPDVSIYRKKDEKMNIGYVQLSDITYHYYNNMLYAIIIKWNNCTNLEPLSKALEEKYNARRNNGDIYIDCDRKMGGKIIFSDYGLAMESFKSRSKILSEYFNSIENHKEKKLKENSERMANDL